MISIVTEAARTVGGADGAHSVAFEAFGIRLGVTADPAELLRDILRLLPPGSRRCVPADVTESFGIHADEDGTYRFTREDSPVMDAVDLELALLMLDNQLRMTVGLHAPRRIFVHAGAVAHNGRAIVIPGLSMAGKTTLVAALIRAGAVYYSDEYAVLDERGLVHPYAKPLSVRNGEVTQSDQSAESLGGVIGEEPVRIGAVMFTHYRPGAEWKPTRLSAGRGALAMLEHTLAAMERTDEALRVIKRSLAGAVLLEGERGDAAAIAPRLLEYDERA
jgi:hypothetical protein